MAVPIRENKFKNVQIGKIIMALVKIVKKVRYIHCFLNRTCSTNAEQHGRVREVRGITPLMKLVGGGVLIFVDPHDLASEDTFTFQGF